MLFRDGLEVDFSILPAAVANAPPPEAKAVLGRGFRVVYDDIGLNARPTLHRRWVCRHDSRRFQRAPAPTRPRVKLLDTTVAIDHLRGVDPAVDLLRQLIDEGETVLASEVVRFELLAGVADDELEALEQFFSALWWVPVDEGVSRTAGLLARKHRRAHSGIDDARLSRRGDRPFPRRLASHDQRAPLSDDRRSPLALLTVRANRPLDHGHVVVRVRHLLRIALVPLDRIIGGGQAVLLHRLGH